MTVNVSFPVTIIGEEYLGEIPDLILSIDIRL